MTRRQTRHNSGRTLPQNPIVYLAAEGITERDYFALLVRDRLEFVRIETAPPQGGQEPANVLADLNAFLSRELGRTGLGRDDIAAVVVDEDQRPGTAFSSIETWARQDSRHVAAISRPRFEVWLYLHFDSASGVRSSRDLIDKLEREIPGFGKRLTNTTFRVTNVSDAVHRGKQRLRPEDDLMPGLDMSTGVCLLVERILELDRAIAARRDEVRGQH